MTDKTIVPIPGFFGYFVSSDGTVYSRKVRLIPEALADEAKVIKPAMSGNGYHVVTLCRDGAEHKKYIHRLVLESFVGDCPEFCEALHKDGDRLNNSLENLAWGSRKDNVQDMLKHGTATIGSKNNQAKLTDSDIGWIADMSYMGFSPKEISKKFAVTTGTIRRILSGQTYKKEYANVVR